MLKRSIIIGLFVALLGCTEEIAVEEFSYPHIFTGESQKSWKMRTVQIVRSGKGTLTVPPDYFFDDEGETCISDDIYTFSFNSERSYKVTEGATKCSDTDPDVVYEGSWAFVNSTAVLTILMPALASQPLPFIVYQVDENQLVLDIYLDEENKNNYRFNFRPVDTE